MPEQMLAKNFDEERVESRVERVQREFRNLLERYPERLTATTRPLFEHDLRLLMSMGPYQSEDGYDEVRVEEVALDCRFDHACDAHVAFVTTRGFLPDGRLPVVFFLEVHRFVRGDAASL